jgi:hypothetical protein
VPFTPFNSACVFTHAATENGPVTEPEGKVISKVPVSSVALTDVIVIVPPILSRGHVAGRVGRFERGRPCSYGELAVQRIRPRRDRLALRNELDRHIIAPAFSCGEGHNAMPFASDEKANTPIVTG